MRVIRQVCVSKCVRRQRVQVQLEIRTGTKYGLDIEGGGTRGWGGRREKGKDHIVVFHLS